MPNRKAIAHAAKNASTGEWREPHSLEEHLRAVAKMSSDFAKYFGHGDWGFLAGLWHDLGKYRPRFQNYIRKVSGYDAEAHIQGEAGKAPHSTAGALHACERFGLQGRVLAYLIAGHHAGLSDWHDGLDIRLQLENSSQEYRETLAQMPPLDILDHGTFKPNLAQIPGKSNGFALWTRMLFSCLIDADRLDTESYMDADKAAKRAEWANIESLRQQFNHFMQLKASRAADTDVNNLRATILQQCREKALAQPGLFSLTVPTGGGKTLSSLAFALDHAARYEKRRIIYVIPYTSIIEQTANIFREIFGDAVIEHHSNAEADPQKENHKSHLATENWDAPVIVTTNVQFFESLFAAKTSRCRKLHNIVNSVVVLDEAQLLPPDFLQPILDVLNLLSEHYGVTLVLSTATQPALSTRSYFDARNNMRGLNNVREIINDPDALYKNLDRVNVRLPADWNARGDWDALAKEIDQYISVLAIVNRRQDARELWQRLPKGTLHLSALMCGQHRSDTIAQIKKRLKDGIPTRVVSTQLVEAGVDVDFPVVYRAMAGLDSIAQAAGRCNREGELAKGEVIVFNPPQASPLGLLRHAEDACRGVLQSHDGHALERKLFAKYFEKLYHACELDKHGIVKLLTVEPKTLGVNFATAADKFKLIQDEDSVPIIVLYYGADGSDKQVDVLVATLKKDGPVRWLMRKLQRYTVTIARRQANTLQAQGDIEEVLPGMYLQVSDCLYDPQLGLIIEGMLPSSPALIV